MEVRNEITHFLDELESSSRRTFAHQQEMGEMIELAWSSGGTELLEDAAFHAKFVTRAFDIMRRIGRDADGYNKMESEFKVSSEKAMTLIRTLLKDAPDEIKQQFMDKFLAPTEENLPRVMQLFAELAWIKNWMVDGKSLPWRKK
jgi:hypothetical protein